MAFAGLSQPNGKRTRRRPEPKTAAR
jgi:hypothetical protein